MSDTFNIPRIAITLDSNEWGPSANNIDDTLTDVEDLEEINSNKVKSQLKIKVKDPGITTDVEDLEASDADNDDNIQTVSIDNLHLDACNFDENVAGTFGNLSQNCKIKSQRLLSLSPDECVTDVENVDTENEFGFDDIPDTYINFDDYHSNYTNISTDMMQQTQYLERPLLEENELTDVESIPSDNEGISLIKKEKTKRRRFKGCHKNKESEIDGFDKRKHSSAIKRSLSHPICLSQSSWADFESDEDIEDEVFLNSEYYRKQNKNMQTVLIDLKNTGKHNEHETAAAAKEDSTTTETDIESIDDEQHEYDADVVLPPPIRTVIVLSENKSLVPTTKILPLEDTQNLGLSNDDGNGGTTDVEFFDNDEVLTVENYLRGPTPDIRYFDSSNIYYGENQLSLPRESMETLTDTEDVTIDERPRRSKKIKNKSLHVVAFNEAGLTDTEEFYVSDSNRSPRGSPLKKQNREVDEDSLTPFYIKEATGTTISSKDSNGTSTTRNRLNVVKANVLTSPNLTDFEDLVGSGEEDAYTEMEVPSEFSAHLDLQRSTRVHVESTKKLDWNSPNEIMYLKGGSFYHNHTDVEEISDGNGGEDFYYRFNSETMKDWDVSKKSATQEKAPLPQDAEQQATPNYVTYESVLLRPDRDSPSSPHDSYREIDAMLEKMLVEVEQQEKLFSLDLDILEPNDDSFVNTLELVPETDALIEIPVKKPQVFESYREIQIASDDCDEDEPFSSFLISRAKTTSDESLTDEDDGYEPVEYNALTHVYQRFDTQPESEVWFEGTYRNLSIVPEEDEDESTSLLSNYSNCRTHSTSSNQYSLYDSVPLQDPSDSTDSPSTDDSDLDERPDRSESIVKAEVKLLVKTSERGKEAIEIRSVREFLENPPEKMKTPEAKKKSQLGDKISSLKNKFSSIVDRSRRNFNIKPNENESCEDLLKKDKKPSFTFQQLFVKTPEPVDSSLQDSKRFGSRNELVASSSERFPLVYDPEVPLRDEDVIKEIGSVDLYANIPFYPCYNRSDVSQYGFKSFSSPHTNPFTETTSTPFNENDQIPRAYCDWLEDDGGGLSTTTERLVASNEETLLDKPLGQQLTGLSVIDDYLVTDLKTVCEQTNAFIQSESQPEPYDALADKYTRKEPINEKKVDDNKNNMNEKKKAKKGFFGSIKTFVERSFESDSESEKSPKKSKKPKKDKKKKHKEDTAVGEHALPPRKPKLPTPPLEPSDIDSIPFAEASVSDLPPPYKPPEIPIKEEQIPVTDLDADIEIQQVQVVKKTVAPEQEPEKLSKPITDEKDKEKGKTKDKPKEKEKKKIKGKTIIVEEVTKTIEPLVIEAEEFSIIVDPTKKESPKKSKETFTINIDESIEKKEKEILEKSPILTEEKIVKPLAALEMHSDVPIRPPRARDHIYEDIEEPVVTIPQDRVKDITTELIQNEINFGGWSDVPAVAEKFEKEDESQKEIVEKHDKEVLKEKDAKDKQEEEVKKKEEKKGGFFGLFKKKDSKKEEEAPPNEKEEKVEETKKPELSEATLQDMNDSQQFLLDEVQNYHDVHTLTASTAETVTTVTVTTAAVTAVPIPIEKTEEIKVEEPKPQSESFFGLFKKQKKEEKPPGDKKSESTEKKSKKDDKKVEEKKVAVVLSQEVLRNILDSKRFLEGEVQNYHDARLDQTPIEKTPELRIQVTEEYLLPKEIVDESLLPKSSKVTAEHTPKKALDDQKESSPQRAKDDTKEPSPKKAVDDKREPSPKPSPGFFGLFKKSKKDEPDTVEVNIKLPDEVVKEMKETDEFLVAEIENYHDVKPSLQEKVVEEPAESVKIEVETTEAQSGGFFGLFKKSKKEEEAQPPKITISEDTLKDMSDTKAFLSDEVKNYHDVCPASEKVIEEEKVTESAEQPSSSFFGLFKKTKKEDEKIVPDIKKEDVELFTSSVTVEEYPEKIIKIEEDKTKKVVEEVRESSPKPTSGFFGLFKKSKKDEEETIPSKPSLSDSVVKDMDDTNEFLSTEVNNYDDVKPTQFEQIEVEKTPTTIESSPKPSRGVFDIFKKSKKDEQGTVEPEPCVSATADKEIEDTEQLIKGEVGKYQDVQKDKIVAETEKITKVVEEGVESSPKSSRGLFGIFKKTKKDSEEGSDAKPIISEIALQAMNDTKLFLTGEVDNYHDVKPAKFEQIEEDKIVKGVEELVESSPKPSRGLFGIFKKSKKDQEEVSDTKPILSESVEKDMADTDTFLTVELEHYDDAKPINEENITRTEDTVESSVKPSKGLFSMFKKPKKDEEVFSGVVLSETVVREMEDTKQFLTGEVDNYQDVKVEETSEEEKPTKVTHEEVDASPKPTKVTHEEVDSSPKTSRGLFSIFKSPKKDKEEPAEVKTISLEEEIQRNIADTDRFLTEEVEKYHDVRVVAEEKVPEVIEEVKDPSTKPTGGVLGIFKKTKKEEIEVVEITAPISETVHIVIDDTQQTVTSEVEKIEDIKPAITEEVTQLISKTEVQDIEPKPEVRGGFLFKFKKTKKKPSLAETQLSEEVQKSVDDTKNFLSTELKNYEDSKEEIPAKDKKEEKTVTFEATKSKMVLEGHLPQPEVAQVVDVIKAEMTDVVKEAEEELKEVENVVLHEATEVQHIEPQDSSSKKEKEKQTKDRKGFFHRFGKKSKSQETSFDESRGRSIEDGEESPKKQKRRKSSSPFKFFDKMKKTEEEIKEAEPPVEVNVGADTKAEVKEELLAVEFEEEPAMDLSKEVLGSLDKKMEALKSKYTSEVQKQINDCRDFLFIEVDNYEDAKPVVVTDIDTGLSTDAGKTVDDIIETATKVVEDSKNEVDAAKSDAVDSAEKIVSHVEESARKATKKADKKSGGFFSKLGNLISGTVDDAKSEAKDAKKSAEKAADKAKQSTEKSVASAGKTVDSGVQKMKEKTQDAQQVVSDKMSQTKDTIKEVQESAQKTTQEKIDDVVDLKDSATDTTAKKLDETRQNVIALKESLLEATAKAGQKLDNLKKDTVVKAETAICETKEIKDAAATKADVVAKNVEAVVDKTKVDMQKSAQELDDSTSTQLDEVRKAKETIQTRIEDAGKIAIEKSHDVCDDLKKDGSDLVSAKVAELEKTKLDATEAVTKKGSDVKKDIKAAAAKGTETVAGALGQIFDSTAQKIEEVGKAKDASVETVTKKVEEAKVETEATALKFSDVAAGKLDHVLSAADAAKTEAETKASHIIDETGKSTQDVMSKVETTAQEAVENVTVKADSLTKKGDKVIEDVQTSATQKIGGIVTIGENIQTAAAQKIDATSKALTEKAETLPKAKESFDHSLGEIKKELQGSIEQKAAEIRQAEGNVENTVAAKVDVLSTTTSQKAEDFRQMKQNIVDSGIKKLDDLQKAGESVPTAAFLQLLEQQKETVAEKCEDTVQRLQDSAQKKVDEIKNTKDELQRVIETKVEDVSKTASQKIDTFEKAKKQLAEKTGEVKKSVVEKVDQQHKVISQKSDHVVQLPEDIKDASERKLAEISEITAEKMANLSLDKKQVEAFLARETTEASKAKEDIKKAASVKVADVTKAATEKIDELVQMKETVKESSAQKADELTKAASDKIEDLTKVKSTVEAQASQAASDFVTAASQKIEETGKFKEEASKKIEEIDSLLSGKIDISKPVYAQKIEDVKDAAKSDVQYISERTSKKVDELVGAKEKVEKLCTEKGAGIIDDLSGKKERTIDEAVQAKTEVTNGIKGVVDQKISALTSIGEDVSKKANNLVQEASEKIMEFPKVKDSAERVAAHKVDQICKTGVDKVQKMLTKGDAFATSTAKKSEEDLNAVEFQSEGLSDLTKKVDETLKTVEGLSTTKLEDLTKTKHVVFEQEIEDAGEVKKSVVEDLPKVEGIVKDTSVKIIEELSKKKKLPETMISDAVVDEKKAAASKILELDDQLAQLTSSLEQLSQPIVLEGDKIKSYVTSPTMARRAESQRFSREERPTVREVRTIQDDEESDEEKYTVTEPEETQDKKRKPLFHLESEEDDAMDLTKMKDRRDSVKSNVLETLTENKLDNLLSDLESQLVKDLERSVTEVQEKTEDKEKAGIELGKAECELEAIKKDSQADVEQIEQKLRDLDKALDSLEHASDPKLEKKLHRVERKFERMASEAMDKDVAGVSPTEVETHREHEFQKLVSQLSTEEVSDFQKEYTHLWDETTFSKSDDWDSKTPDSQVDVLELPQGEVVYMGPVTLNKDNLVNKAGVEVDVIPIMRSPCHTPRPTKKNKRARSAMDFYEETSPPKDFDRGSLPDLKRTSLKGSLVSTIIQLNPDRFLYGSTTSLRSTASSSSDLSRGEIMNAVLDWLDKSNRLDESSVDTVSIASSDSNLSQPNGKPYPAVPAILITKGQGKKRAKRKGKNERRETTCAPTLTEEIKTIPQPKPRFAKETPLQFKEGRQPKLEKQISPVRDDLLDDDEVAVPETYSDKKKFWENVTKDKKISLHEESTHEEDILKKRVSVPEVPIPKPRSQVQVSQTIEEAAPSQEDEEPETKIMSEYQASFQPPSERKSKSPPKVESDKESTDSESDVAHSGTNENAGYISDSGDVEHYISDSEIEDRVPQIRERQMSVFAPPVAAARKTIYERSASLPTEDMYEVSARSIKLRKQYYEEQIKKEMIEEQLTSEIEEEPSPERKTLISSLVEQMSEEKVSVRDIARSFDEATKKEVSFDDSQTHKPEKTIAHIEDETPISQQFQETHKEIDVDTQTKRSSIGSEQSSSSDIDRATRNGSTSKPDSMEVHVDKSEIEDSEKLADFDQDATDLETKSLEMSPKSPTFVDETIPEITVTLSGKQRRISEESDEYAPKPEKKPELDSPIHVPEEHVEDTVWEVSVQSQPEARFNEKVISFDGATVEKIDEDLSLSTRDESDLGSEIHQDHSDSYASDKIKSESHSDIERIIMDSLQHQKVDPIEAKAIASALIEEIEAEIQRRECLPPTTATEDVSDYLKYLAETKGLDEREVELVESVLARRQRELAKLSRGDTQASSIEITDEDLKYSGTEGDTSHVLEQQISQLKAEKLDDIKSMTMLDKIDEKHIEETHLSKDYETYKDGFTTALKNEVHTRTFESIKGEKSEAKDTIFEEDETISESVTQESEQLETRVEAVTSETVHKKVKGKEIDEYRETSVDVSKEKKTEVTSKTAETEGEDVHKRKIEDTSHESDVTKSIIKHQVDVTEKSPTEEIKLTGAITSEDYLSKEESTKKETTSEIIEIEGVAVEKEEAVEKSHTKTVQKEVLDKETEEKRTQKGEDSVLKESKTSSKVTSTDVIRESSTVTEVKEKIEVVDIDSSLLPTELDEVKTVIDTHKEIKRTSSSESKSSIESGKSPEDQFSSCSSGRKGDSDSSKIVEKQEVLMRRTSALQKADRKSGIDFENYSSSGESHYHSFELDSGKSRPCSSDVEGLVAAGSSEYESALTSQDYSARSHITSTEYHTAVSSLSSKESMKSLDSESSGHLGSVEVSELSETLVPSASDAEGDILDAVDQLDDGPWNEEIMDEPSDTQTKMKRSHEMTFQPEPKILAAESPQADELDRKFTSMDDGSIVSMSLSSTSGTTEPRTVIELSRADSERMEGGSMSVSGISDQLSIEGSCDSLVFHPTAPLTTIETGTSTGQIEGNLQIESITITTSMVNESGIRSVSTQVTSESHTPEEDRVTKVEEAQMNGKCPPETKKKTHRRQESTSSFVPPVLSSFDQKFHSDLTESDKYTAELSFKEVISDEKKDIDEREREESYETEADQGFHRDIREGKYHETEEEIKDDTPEFSSETQASVGELEQEYSSALARTQEAKKKSETSPDLHLHKEPLEKRDSHGKSSSTSSEKSSFEEAEAEAAFNMVAHVSPAHKIKQICPILEDEDAEKHELETRERAQKEYEKRRSQVRDQSPGSIPDIKVTQHMAPLVDRDFRYPDLELEEQERAKEKEKEAETQKSTPQTPSSKSSEDTDQGREYVLEDSGISIPEEATTESRSTVIEQTVREEADKDTDSPNSDSFEMLEKPDLIDDFVVIEEVAKEAQEFDSEGKSVSIQQKSKQKQKKKHDEEVEAYLTSSAPTPLTRMTDVKFYPDGSSSEELGFDFEDSPPINNEATASSYEKELEANKKWIEQQFQGDQAARLAAGYDYEMEFERGPLEDIKEEDINDLDPTSSRIGSLGSQKESGGSLGSVKDSYSSTPEYDVLAGRKYFTRSGEHDDISMSSLQEFENLERAMSLETKKYHQGSQDSSSNGSFKTRYNASKSGQGDDVSVSSLKEFEGLEMACIAAHKIETKAKEEEAMLAQIDEGQESIASESESCETVSRTDKKIIPDSDEEDYEKRMFEIDEIIRQAQSNVERFIDLKEADKTESLGRGDSIEEVSKVPELDLDTPIVRTSVKVQWKGNEDVMVTSTDSIDGKEEKVSQHDSTDSLDQKTCADVMTASTDSIEFQAKKTESEPINLLSDSIEIKDEKDEACGMISSDSLELATKQSETMLESTDSLADPTSSTATHATYQYETDSVFSGSFTSGGSNTMVSSTDTIDPVQVDIAAAARKVWFDEETGSSRKFTTEYIQDTTKPYVTEVIEPSEEDGFSHTVHRRVELPPEIRKVTFHGSDADERLRQFIEDFNEGEHVEEVQEVDAAGNVHTRRVVQKRFIIKGEEGPDMEEFIKKTVASKTNQLTSFPKETTGEESSLAATGGPQDSEVKAQVSRRRQLRYEISVDDQIEVDPREHDWRFNLPKHAEGEESTAGGQQADSTSSQQRPVGDQHQLSEEMKQLLKELEKESKQ